MTVTQLLLLAFGTAEYQAEMRKLFWQALTACERLMSSGRPLSCSGMPPARSVCRGLNSRQNINGPIPPMADYKATLCPIGLLSSARDTIQNSIYLTTPSEPVSAGCRQRIAERSSAAPMGGGVRPCAPGTARDLRSSSSVRDSDPIVSCGRRQRLLELECPSSEEPTRLGCSLRLSDRRWHPLHLSV